MSEREEDLFHSGWSAALQNARTIGEMKRAIWKATRLIGAKDTPKHKNLAQARKILQDILKKYPE